MVVECETGFHFRRRGDRLVLAMSDASRAGASRSGGGRVALRRSARAARAALSRRRRTHVERGVGRAVRHDARCAPDHRAGRRRRLRSVRVLGPRLHAVAGGRGALAGGDPRRATPHSTCRRTGSSASRAARSSPRRSSSSGLEREPAARELLDGETALDGRLDVELLADVGVLADQLAGTAAGAPAAAASADSQT